MTTIALNRTGAVAQQPNNSLATWLSRIVMIPPTIIMVLIGTKVIANPTHALAATGVNLTTPEALTDTRATGALALTIAFALAYFLLSRSRLRMGHLMVMAMMGLILAVRIFGFAVDGTTLAMGDQKVKFTGEIVFLILNSIGFWFRGRISKPEGAPQ